MNDDAFERFLMEQFDRARDGASAAESSLHTIVEGASGTRQRPRWLALVKEPPMRISSQLAVGSPTVRVAALAIATMLLTVLVAAAGVAGSRLLAAEETGFPTGTFVAAEWSPRAVEFRDDGTCLWLYAPGVESGMPCTYSVEGDLFTETSYESNTRQQHPAATYRWALDDDLLSFELVGEDPSPHRRAFYEEQPYRFVPEPQLTLLAAYDIAAGTELLAGHTVLSIVPGAGVPGDALSEKEPATGRVAVADITKGQPITPDLLATE